MHSVPNFPPKPGNSYSYPNSGLRNGQSFLCVSLRSGQLGKVANLLHHNCPHFYATQMSPAQRARYPLMSKVIDGNCDTGNSSFTIQTLYVGPSRTEFKAFAKTSKFGKDLYSDLVAPRLETDLYAETWRNGAGGPLPSYCSSPRHVLNVQLFKVRTASRSRPYEFPSTTDHSKWAVSGDNRNPWVCIGDINRMRSQFGRGGGTVCCRNDKLWKLYWDMVADYEPCAGSVQSWLFHRRLTGW